MNLSYSLILAFVSIAESTSAYVAFGNSLEIIRFEVIKYCADPTEYDKSSSGEKYGFGPIKDWNVSALTTMHALFSPHSASDSCPNCNTCNPPVGNWDVGAVENFNSMFFGATAFDQDLSGWDVRKGINFANMFSHSGMNHYIGGWVLTFVFEDRLSVFGQMLDGTPFEDMPDVERQQLINLITPVNTESCVTKIDSALADLDLADKEKKECRQGVEKIDEIKKIIQDFNFFTFKGQMLDGTPFDMPDVERQQFIKLITPVNTESCVTKIDSALASLDLADKEKKECRQYIEKIDEIKKIIEGCEYLV